MKQDTKERRRGWKVTVFNYDLNIPILFMSEKVGEINDIVVSS